MLIPAGTVIGADGLRGDPDTVPTDASLYNHPIGSGASAPEGVGYVYVWDGTHYVLTGGRAFVGPTDEAPEDDGFTLADGDHWDKTA